MTTDDEPDRFYTIQCPSTYPFESGILPGGGRAILGIVDDLFTLVRFNQSGGVDTVEQRDMPDVESENGYEEAIWAVLNEWKQALGFDPHSIQVLEFHLPALRIGIHKLPESFKRFLANPEAVQHSARRQQWYDDIQEWESTHKFVFQWGDEYWMDSNGNVFAT